MIILTKTSNEKKNAGPKAPSDIISILNDAKHIDIKDNKFRKLAYLYHFLKLHFSKDIILVQHPLLFDIRMYKLLNKERTIILIHDISGLRVENEDSLNKELSIFKYFKYIIVHNESMKKYLIDKGVDSNNIYVLELFDYLCKNNINEEEVKDLEVVYAGNLKKEKTPFIYQLDDKKLNFKFNLYGLGISEDISKKLRYYGSFEPDDLSTIKGKVGLIWDGNYDESDQDATFKNYTRYNNPHKLSCYVAAGLPVIAWEKAAIADFIKKYDIGYTINSIYDINNIDLSDYNKKKKNVMKISGKVKEGYYTKRVVNSIIKKINKNK